MKADVLTLDDLGFNAFFASALQEIDSADLIPARVISERKHAYQVVSTQGEFLARITGRRMFEATEREQYPAVGDWVLILPVDSKQASIKIILPRQTIIKRSVGDKNKAGEKSDTQIIATNIDVGFIIESVDRDYNLNRFERYMAMLEESAVTPVIILNKIDLLTEAEKGQKLTELKRRFPHTSILATSTVTSDGLASVLNYIEKGKTYCFLGSSGVGKSSLINELRGTQEIKTGEVSTHAHRGKHTTTGRQMYFLASGGMVIDNPGIREVGMTDVSESISDLFDDITTIGAECRFINCSHTHEPGCAVREGVAAGTIDTERYLNFINLKKEAAYFELNKTQKRQASKDFGKIINTAKKGLRDAGYDGYR